MPSKTNQRIVITGANGFIGSFLVKYFYELGYTVIALSHKTSSTCYPGVTYGNFDLGSDRIEETLIEKNDIVIHCAYCKKGDSKSDVNISGLKSLISVCNKKQVKKHIFFSSISAKPNTSSYYGAHKYQSTQLFNKNDAILTTGLVIGQGGVFMNTLNFIQKSSIIPTVQGGKQPVYYVGISEVALTIYQIIKNDLSGNFLVANPSPVDYTTFYKTAIRQKKSIASAINLPIWLMRMFIQMNGWLKKPFVTQENLNGLIELTYLENVDQMIMESILYADLPDVLAKELKS